MKKTSKENPAKSLGYIKCYSSSSPRSGKSPSNSIRKYAVKPDAIKNTGNQKKNIFLKLINKSIIHKFLKDFTNERKKTTRTVVFGCRPLFSTFLKTSITGEILPKSGKRIYSKHILKRSTNMYKSSGLQFFRGTTGI